MSSLALLLTLVVSLLTLWKLAHRFFFKTTLDNLPGPPPSSFVSGSLGDITARGTDDWKYHQEISDKYGGVMRIKGILGANELYVSDPKALHQILVKDQAAWEHTDGFFEFQRAFFGGGIFVAVGERHRLQKKMLNPFFSIAHMRQMIPIFYEVAHRVHNNFLKKASTGSVEVDLIEWMTRVALELIGTSGLGFSFDSLADGSVPHPYAIASKQLVPLSCQSTPLSLAIFPKLCKIGPASFRRFIADRLPFPPFTVLTKIVDTLYQTSIEIVDLKRKELEAADSTQEGKDIITMLLKANAQAAENDWMTDEEVLGQVSALTLAATDTTSNALARTLYLLAKHPDVQQKLRAEIRSAREGNNGHDLEYDTLVNLPFLDAICRETLRLYPPLSVAERSAHHDTVLSISPPIKGVDGKDIESLLVPKGTNVHISVIQCNRNVELWGPDAHEWKPERWLNPLPQSLADARIPGVYSHLMTFLGGNRSCLGFKFSQLEMKVVLALLLEDLEFFPSEKKIYWQMNVIATPNVDPSGTNPTLPMKIRLASPSS